MINYLTLYGNLVPVCFYRKELNVVDMQASDPCHYAFRKHVLMWNSGDQKGAVTTASNRLFWKYFIQMCRLDVKYLLRGDRVAEEYRTRGKELTAIDFWKEHLGLKNSVKQVRLPARWSREAE